MLSWFCRRDAIRLGEEKKFTPGFETSKKHTSISIMKKPIRATCIKLFFHKLVHVFKYTTTEK